MAQLEESKFLRVPRREKWLKVFLFYSGVYLSLLEIVRIQKHGEICEVVDYELEMTWMGLRWNVPGPVAFPTSFQQIASDKTLQVLVQRHARCRWAAFKTSVDCLHKGLDISNGCVSKTLSRVRMRKQKLRVCVRVSCVSLMWVNAISTISIFLVQLAAWGNSIQ